MKTFLGWIEAHSDEEITEEEFIAVRDKHALMIDIDIVDASRQMWAYLNINLQRSRIETFRNVAMLNGAEAWRRIVSPIINNSAPKRSHLRDKAWSPKQAGKLATFYLASTHGKQTTDYLLRLAGRDG